MVVYKITNNINGKIYIGQTINSIKKRFQDHCLSVKSVIGLAIQKYGKENFTIESIYIAQSLEELNIMEQELIKLNNCIAPNGYNLREGGNNSTHSEISRKKMSVSAKNKPPIKDETRKKLSEACKGEKHYFYGKTLDPEHRKILSDCAKTRTGEKNPMFGKTHTEEVKQKQSKRVSGEKNGMAKLTIDKVLKIREDFKNNVYTIQEFAKMYNVSPKTIQSVIYRNTWKHI